MNITTKSSKFASRFHGITERKKAELDSLALQVLDAQQMVDQYQAIVISLTNKLTNFQGFLADADTKRAAALSNKNFVDQLVNNANDLKESFAHDDKLMIKANHKGAHLAAAMKTLIDRLIFTADIINKLSMTVAKQKAMNPLVSDELVSRLSKAGTDANNAVALTLVALKSTFAAQAANTESAKSTAYGKSLSVTLAEQLKGGAHTHKSLSAEIMIAFESALTTNDAIPVVNFKHAGILHLMVEDSVRTGIKEQKQNAKTKSNAPTLSELVKTAFDRNVIESKIPLFEVHLNDFLPDVLTEAYESLDTTKLKEGLTKELIESYLNELHREDTDHIISHEPLKELLTTAVANAKKKYRVKTNKATFAELLKNDFTALLEEKNSDKSTKLVTPLLIAVLVLVYQKSENEQLSADLSAAFSKLLARKDKHQVLIQAPDSHLLALLNTAITNAIDIFDKNKGTKGPVIALKSVLHAEFVKLLNASNDIFLQDMLQAALTTLLVGACGAAASEVSAANTKKSLQHLLHKDYAMCQHKYTAANNAVEETTRQLNIANALLSKAIVNLKSLQSGLAAANAAALAS